MVKSVKLGVEETFLQYFFFSKVVSDLFAFVIKCGHDINQKNMPSST